MIKSIQLFVNSPNSSKSLESSSEIIRCYSTPRQVRIQSQRRFDLSSDEAVTVVQCAVESAEQTKGHGEDLLDMGKVA